MIGGGAQIITFYSYKGGTGRSMHLANVAWILASNGKRVLMIDWDLEAPGLHRYFQPFLIDKELIATDGLIDLMWDFSDAAMTPVPDAERQQGWHEAYTDLTRCTAAVRWTFPPPGRLDLLAAGRQGASYSRRVTAFNWQNFYDRLGGGVFLESLKARMRKAYDYVLIDSRTGVTDTAGICTVQLPDALVVCFTPNNQSIEGCAAIAQSVRAQWTQDGQRADHRRILPLLTRIDGFEKDKLNARRALVRKRFTEFLPGAAAEAPDAYWRDTEVPYVPWYSYEEVLAVFADKYQEKISVLDSAEALTRLLTHGEIAAAIRPSDEQRGAVMKQIGQSPSEEAAAPVRKPDAAPASPYPGLRPFSSKNATVFFGRKAELEALVARLRAGERELYVVGPSGSGKSSLVHAGLVPLLTRSAGRDVPRFLILTVTPGVKPVARLADAFEIGPEVDASGWSGAAEALLARHADCERILVIVDQVEELFTTAPDEQHDRMIAALGALRSQPRVALLLVVRSDFYGRLLDSPLWAGHAPIALHVVPLRGDALREAIVGPAQAVGAHIEPALVERLLADAAEEPGALPLLQDTLSYLWERSAGGVLTVARYTEIGGNLGGLAAALALRAEAIYADLDKPGQDAARLILLRLVSFGEGRAATRRRQRRDELAAGQDALAFEPTLRVLVDRRLLTTDLQDGVVQVDLASEHLITAWSRLRQWLEALRDDEQRRRELEAAAALWNRSGRDRGALLGAAATREALRWLRRDGTAELGVSEDLRALVAASHGAQRRRSAVLYGCLVLGLGGLIAVTVLWDIASRREADAEHALRDLYLAQGRTLLARDQGAQAAPYFLAARELGIDDLATRTSFQWARWQIPELSLYHRDAVGAIAWSPGGASLVTATSDGALRFWDASTGKRLALVEGHNAGVLAMAWSPDGKQLATACVDGTVAVWTDAGRPAGPPFHHDGAVLALEWSPDGARLATASVDGTARIWQVATGGPITAPLAHMAAVPAVAWSPDGTRLATASLDGTARIWNTATGAPVQSFRGAGDMRDVAWSSDGARLTTVERDHGVKIWEAASGKLLRPLLEGVTPIHTTARSPDGAKLAVAGSEGTVAIIDQDGLTSQQFRSPVAVEWISWSQRNMRLAVGGADQLVHVWDVATRQEISVAFALSTSMTAMRLDPDGQRVAAGGRDGSVRLWRVQSRLAVPARLAHEAPVERVAWTPDGATLVTGDAGGVVSRWGAKGGVWQQSFTVSSRLAPRAWSGDATRIAVQSVSAPEQVRVFDVRSGSVLCTVPTQPREGLRAMSPDGTRFVTYTDADRRLVVWDVRACAKLAVLPGSSAGIANVTWDPSGRRIAFTSTDNAISIWRVDEPGPASFPSKASVFALAWSPDGTRLATAGADRIARIWDVSTRGVVATTPVQSGQLAALAWSPDGTRFATASAERTVQVWSAASGAATAPPLIHPGAVTALAWSPDGERLATASEDHGLRIWDAVLGQPLCPPIFHPGAITVLTWSPDGKELATGSDDHFAQVWDLGGDGGSLVEWRHAVDASPYVLATSGTLLPRESAPSDDAR